MRRTRIIRGQTARRLTRLLIALLALAAGVLASGCDVVSLCYQAQNAPPPGPAELLARALYCRDYTQSPNPVVPAFKMLVEHGTSVGDATAVNSGDDVVFDPAPSYILPPYNHTDPIATYQWVIDGQPMPARNYGEAVFDERFNTTSIEHLSIVLNVTDGLGNTAYTERILTVLPAASTTPLPDVPPSASFFTFMLMPAGLSTDFNAAGSNDARGQIVDYQWDFGDGTPIVDSQRNALVSHVYGCIGPVTVTLTVTNDAGQTGEASQALAVPVNPGHSYPACNGASGPVPSFTETPSATTPENPVTFNASGTTDPVSTITDYTWDFGDGTGPVSSGLDPTVIHSYFCTGTLTVTLTVTDGQGQTAQATRTETVANGAGQHYSPCLTHGAADTAPSGSRIIPRYFQATFARTRLLALGNVTRRGKAEVLQGLRLGGVLDARLVGSRSLGKFDHARFLATLNLTLDSRRLMTMDGWVIATFPGGTRGSICVRVNAVRHGNRLPIGSFRVAGATGALRGVTGSGTFVYALGHGKGRLAGRLQATGSSTAASRRQQGTLPPACQALQASGS